MKNALRCQICDYVESEGSSYANISVRRGVTVRRYKDETFCSECEASVRTTLSEFQPSEDKDDEL